MKTAIIRGFRDCFNFKDRSSRSEIWFFYLFSQICFFFAYIIDLQFNFLLFQITFFDIINQIPIQINIGHLLFFLCLLFIIPLMAMNVRRFHDINLSGWWALISFIIFGLIACFIVWAIKGNDSQNNYGPVP